MNERGEIERCEIVIYLCQFEKANGLHRGHLAVRLQWDPDHSPTYGKMQRRAIQLGLKGEVI